MEGSAVRERLRGLRHKFEEDLQESRRREEEGLEAVPSREQALAATRASRVIQGATALQQQQTLLDSCPFSPVSHGRTHKNAACTQGVRHGASGAKRSRVVTMRSPFGGTKIVLTADETRRRKYKVPRASHSAGAAAAGDDITLATAPTTVSEYVNKLYGREVEHSHDDWREEFADALRRREAKQERDQEFYRVYQRVADVETKARTAADYDALEAVVTEELAELAAVPARLSQLLTITDESAMQQQCPNTHAVPGAAAATNIAHDTCERCATAAAAGGRSGTLPLRTEPQRARTQYARRALRSAMPPVPLVDERVDATGAAAAAGSSGGASGAHTISLPHRALGDRFCALLSSVVPSLPPVTSVDLRDNRLSDAGIRAVVDALRAPGQCAIRRLDLSENKLDEGAARSLGAFLQLPACKLEVRALLLLHSASGTPQRSLLRLFRWPPPQELFLQSADMDDAETEVFMAAMEANSSIATLDFSHNAIGGMTEKLLSGAVMGGRAIARALERNKTLCRLDLSWNKLGSTSGVLLGRALERNHSLESLVIAYNALGDQGAQAIGHALRLNRGLEELDLSYNEVTPRGALVLAQALEVNECLTNLQLNGNSIGFQGGRCLVRSLNYWTIGRRLGVDNCNLESLGSGGGGGGGGGARGAAAFFDPQCPTGAYALRLADPYDWAVAYELLRGAAMQPSWQLRGCALRAEHGRRPPPSQQQQQRLSGGSGGGGGARRGGGGGGGITQVRLEVPEEALEEFGRRRRNAGAGAAAGNGASRMNASEYRALLWRIWPRDAATGLQFELPREGLLELQCTLVPLPPTRHCLLNASGLARLEELMRTNSGGGGGGGGGSGGGGGADGGSGASAAIFARLAARDLRFSAAQARRVLRTALAAMGGGGSGGSGGGGGGGADADAPAVVLLAELLPRVLDDARALRALVDAELDAAQRRALLRRVGPALAAFTDCVCGHYRLDLARDADRQAALRLAECAYVLLVLRTTAPTAHRRSHTALPCNHNDRCETPHVTAPPLAVPQPSAQTRPPRQPPRQTRSRPPPIPTLTRARRRSGWEARSLRALSGWPAAGGGTSQRGRWSSFRNETYRNTPLARGLSEAFFRGALADRAPGVLEFDFASTSRPPAAAAPISDAQFALLLDDCGLDSAPHAAAVAAAAAAAVAAPAAAQQDGSGGAVPAAAAAVAVTAGRAPSLSNLMAVTPAPPPTPGGGRLSMNKATTHARLMALLGGSKQRGVCKGTTTYGAALAALSRVPVSADAAATSAAAATLSGGSDGAASTGDPAGSIACLPGSYTYEPEPAAGVDGMVAWLLRHGVGAAAEWPAHTAQALWRHLAARDCALVGSGGARRGRGSGGGGGGGGGAGGESRPRGTSLVDIMAAASGVIRMARRSRGSHGSSAAATAAAAAAAAQAADGSALGAAAVPETVCTSAMLLAHVVVVRVRRECGDVVLDRRAHPAAPLPPGVSRTFLSRRLQVKGARAGEEPRAVALALLLAEFGALLGGGDDAGSSGGGDGGGGGSGAFRLLLNDPVVQPWSQLCPHAPDVKQRVVLHMVDAYTDALPDAPFVFAQATSPSAAAAAAAAATRPAAATGAELRLRLATAWFTAAQARALVEAVPDGGGGGGSGGAAAAAAAAAAREDAVVALFPRVLDLERFDAVFGALPAAAARHAVARRLGWLNILDPLRIDHAFDLDLRCCDHRRLAEVLTDLAITEPGPNFQSQRFSRRADAAQHEWIPGWDLPDRWSAKTAPEYVKDPGVPSDGHLMVTYCSDEAMGCAADVPLRARHRRERFLVGVPCPEGMGMYGSVPAPLVRALLFSGSGGGGGGGGEEEGGAEAGARERGGGAGDEEGEGGEGGGGAGGGSGRRKAERFWLVALSVYYPSLL
ncbi:hypothetical protein JKP88DRAFT_333762 [Tribonema minus]|uniref:Uncharacterized protein n=1 Tax=Tribonema minus TaxID=303371 RepID=A0A835YKK7_9STRA|nr:hypothetical protein JKP88DRAFT_333762 [Tribonema minus]